MNIDQFIALFTGTKIKYTKRGCNYFLISENIAKCLPDDFYSAGIFLGYGEKEFKPSIVLLDLLAVKTDKKVVVNEKAEWLFLCGRDILEQSVVSSNVKQGPALVMNETNECLGLAHVSGKSIKNMLDRGDFLRREK